MLNMSLLSCLHCFGSFLVSWISLIKNWILFNGLFAYLPFLGYTLFFCFCLFLFLFLYFSFSIHGGYTVKILNPLGMGRLQKVIGSSQWWACGGTWSYGINISLETKCHVPLYQQPIVEYQTLSTSFPSSWPSCDSIEYCSRLWFTDTSFFPFINCHWPGLK